MEASCLKKTSWNLIRILKHNLKKSFPIALSLYLPAHTIFFNAALLASEQNMDIPPHSSQESAELPDTQSSLERLIELGDDFRVTAEREMNRELKQALYRTAFQYYEQAAKHNNAEAQYFIGMFYELGKGVPINLTEAVKWYRLASNQKHPGALFSLGFMYEKRKGITKEECAHSNIIAEELYIKAFKRFEDKLPTKAIHQSTLGWMYKNGRGIQQDQMEGIKWYLLAAKQGYSSAQTNLGLAYEKGQGVPINLTEAVKWYRLAAEQGNSRAQANLGWMYAHGLGVSVDPVEAVRWYRLAAEQGDARAQTNLGAMYAQGQGVSRDPFEAVKWYCLAAEQGYSGGQFNLGWAWGNGQGTSVDHSKAIEWYRLAAEQGDLSAQNNLGVRYQRGLGVQINYKKAVKWYRLAAEQGEASAQNNLGWMYAHGYGVKCCTREAVEWYLKAAKQNDLYSLGSFNLLLMYVNGCGALKNKAKFLRTYKNISKEKFKDLKGFQLTANQTAKLYRKIKNLTENNLENLINLYLYKTVLISEMPEICHEILKIISKENGEKSAVQAFTLYSHQANRGILDAQIKFAAMYQFGLGTVQDQLRAAEWLKELAQKGSSKALALLVAFEKSPFNDPAYYPINLKRCLKAIEKGETNILRDIPGVNTNSQGANLSWFCNYHFRMCEFGKSFKAYATLTLDNLHKKESKQDPTPYLQTAEDCLKEKDKTKDAISNYLQAAELGHNFAYYRLGQLCFEGRHLSYEEEQTLKWHKEQALNGNADAQYSLGLMYEKGLSISQSNELAFEWYLKAAEPEQPEALYRLGLASLTDDLGKPQDTAQAISLLQRSAQQGCPDAHCTLGDLYLSAEGVPYDLDKSIQHYRIAAIEGNEKATEALINLENQGKREARIELGQLYADYLIERPKDCSDETVFKWLSAAVEAGHARALYRLGQMHERGWGTSQDWGKAFACYRECAEKHWFAPAQKALAEMYLKGKAVNLSAFEALRWYSRAAKQGEAGASAAIQAMAHYFTDNSEEDVLLEGLENYEAGSSEFAGHALYALGKAHDERWGIARDEDEALSLYQAAALKGHHKARYMVALNLLNGKGEPSKDFNAVTILTQLADIDARENYLKLSGVLLTRKERKELRNLPQDGYYKAQYKLAELYLAEQIISFDTVETEVRWHHEAIRLYEQAVGSISEKKWSISLEPLEQARARLAYLQQLGEADRFEADYPGARTFIEKYGSSDNLSHEFKQRFARVFHYINKNFNSEIQLEFHQCFQALLQLPINSKSAWGGLYMIERLVDLLSQQRSAMEDIKTLYSQLKTFMPLWRPLMLEPQETTQKFKIVGELLSDPRVEIFNSCFREFEQESYEDTFNGSIQKMKSVLDKFYTQKLTGNDHALTAEQLAFTNQGLDKFLTHDHAADHRFKRRLVRIIDIIEQKFKEVKLNRDTDELVALQKLFCTWGEHGHTMCPAGRDKVLDQFYQDYLKNNPGKSSAALTKEDWSLEMQIAVWLAEFRYQLVDKLVVETDDDRMHAVGHLERKVRIPLSLLGNAEKRRDGLEQTAVPAKYLAMSPIMIINQIKQTYTPENLISYLIKRVNEQPYNKEEHRKAPFWDKLSRRLQFQVIREDIAPHGRMDHSFLRDEDYILDNCTEEEYRKAFHESKIFMKSEEGSSSTQAKDWQAIKGHAWMKARNMIDDKFYNLDGHFTCQGAQILLHSLGYLEPDSFPMQ